MTQPSRCENLKNKELLVSASTGFRVFIYLTFAVVFHNRGKFFGSKHLLKNRYRVDDADKLNVIFTTANLCFGVFKVSVSSRVYLSEIRFTYSYKISLLILTKGLLIFTISLALAELLFAISLRKLKEPTSKKRLR